MLRLFHQLKKGGEVQNAGGIGIAELDAAGGAEGFFLGHALL
jgi:hypothetical protein